MPCVNGRAVSTPLSPIPAWIKAAHGPDVPEAMVASHLNRLRCAVAMQLRGAVKTVAVHTKWRNRVI